MAKQILNFLIHLRLHYQFFILSGGYLLSALFVEDVQWGQFWLQFLNVHVLLFGGATAYNSYWDKDKGPIGGLKSPPKMEQWMWPFSLFIQFSGLLWAFTISQDYAVIYSLSIIFFWLYSTPLARWKGKPVRSLIAIGVSTGTNSFLLGVLAAGKELFPSDYIIALGVAFIILSLYPVSQVFQTEEDRSRGDRTFAIRFGLIGVKRFFSVIFFFGSMLLTFMLYKNNDLLGMLFGGTSLLAFLSITYLIWNLEGEEEEYETVMRIKFLASLSFVLFILGTLIWQNFG